MCLAVGVFVLSPASSAVSRTTAELDGIVTTKSVGPISFGASIARVRAWAGPPEDVSPPQKGYPIPKHRPGTVVLVYACKGAGKHDVCHTTFGFAGGRLVSFMTQSGLFRTAHGARPGMPVDEATRREPGLTIVRDGPGWKGRKVPTLAAVSWHGGPLACLYSRPPSRTPAFVPVC